MSETMFLQLFEEIILNRKREKLEPDNNNCRYESHKKMVKVLIKNNLINDDMYEWLWNALTLPLDDLYENPDYNL